MEKCKGGLHIRPRGVEDADPCKPKSRTVGSADVRTAAFPQEPICLTREGRACPAPTVQSQLKQEQKPSIMSTTSKSKTMIEGPLAKQILLVSLPLALSNLLQILFNMSDVAVVGRFAGSTALGSVGSTATFVTLFTGFLIGLSNGVNVLVARFYGAGHPKDVSKTVHSALLVSLAAGVLLLFVGLFGSPALLELLNTKEDLLPGAILYLRVYFLGMPALALYNFGNAVFSAIGETKKPLAYLSFAGVLNILLSHLGIAPQTYLTRSEWVIPIIILIATWKGAGATALIYMAGMSSVSPELYEAAAIDGAGIWQRIIHIMIPAIKKLAGTLLILQIISVFQIMYEPMVLTKGGPDNASLSLMQLMWQYAFGGSMNYGKASAVAVIVTLILLVMTAIYSYFDRKESDWD